MNKKYNIVNGLNSPEDFLKFSVEETNKIREKLFSNIELFDSFAAENPLNFSSDELKIISDWKKYFVKGRFLIFRYLKNYTIFLDLDKPPKAYGVVAITSTFQEMIGPRLPLMVEAVLLPFNNKIIYDGIFNAYSVIFGGGARRDFEDTYREAKSRFGIIVSLPFSPEEIKQSEADKLRFYLRSKRSYELHQEEIKELIKRNPELLTLYHQEVGKIHARRYGKQLREIGLTKGWFAIIHGLIIASGTTRDEVEQILQHILPHEKRKFVYIFQLKEK